MKAIGKMTKTYSPQSVESRIYEFWNKNGYFIPKIDREKKPFTIIMPPPNVTGALHMGHALTTALEDLMIRWNRMLGKPTLYLPGTDHAGIATQVVVERMLANENITRHDLGREKFIDTIWQWVDKYGGTIYKLMERLGASCDWSRKAFTLDENPAKAVRATFVNLYRKGLIYRGERITNWCPRCLTALSDLEVKYVEETASLYYIRYKTVNGLDSIIISTTRPETLLGDTAVAVNPCDERYEHLVGLKVVVLAVFDVRPRCAWGEFVGAAAVLLGVVALGRKLVLSRHLGCGISPKRVLGRSRTQPIGADDSADATPTLRDVPFLTMHVDRSFTGELGASDSVTGAHLLSEGLWNECGSLHI